MTSTFSGTFARFARRQAGRTAPDLARADILNRLYIAAMFAVIIAIGAFGIFALERGNSSGSVVAAGFEHASDATELRAAQDQEYSELQLQIRRRSPALSGQFQHATQQFDAVYAEVLHDGWANGDPLFTTLQPRHVAFLTQSRAITSALARGDSAAALRIETLGVLTDVSFRAGVSEETADQRFSREQQRLIGAVTLLGIALMAGVAMLLGRYKRSADASARATFATLAQAALTDGLTGLGNNRSFHDDFEREVARAKRHAHSLVLALIDVDDFKSVNDNLGHSHGDAVLRHVGEQLSGTRREDRGYRIGGDEFALLLVETDPEAAALTLGRLQDEIRDCGMGATVSIGYVNLAGDQLDGEAYELADTALYEAKRLGRNQTICFEDVMATVSVFSPRKAEVVRTMIAQGLVSTAFQPIWDMQSTRPLGFEALALPLPELGLSCPQEAFDVAERIRQLPELDALCMRKTLEAADDLPPDAVIFLNYSPASLVHVAFDPKAFVAVVRAAGLLPQQIVIELTERRIDDPGAVARRVAALRALGVRIALDDTGAGHAGLE